jgi:hypothetical protein
MVPREGKTVQSDIFEHPYNVPISRKMERMYRDPAAPRLEQEFGGRKKKSDPGEVRQTLESRRNNRFENVGHMRARRREKGTRRFGSGPVLR